MSHDHHADSHAGGGHDHGHGHDDHPLPFWQKYIFSVDHKVIGIQYTVTALLFLFFGFVLMMLMRYQLAYPKLGDANYPQAPGWLHSFFAGLGAMFGEDKMPDGRMAPEFYNTLGAMHGTIMVFLGVVPLSVGGFGNYVMPLQIGAPDMAFPKLNMLSYWIYFVGGIVMLGSFFVPGGAANSGWTSYPPLSVIGQPISVELVEKYGFLGRLLTGQTLWLIGMVFLITSSLLGSVNFIVTIIQMRAKGLTFARLPFFVWAQFVTSFLLLLAFPPLEAAGILQLMDRVAGTSFFDPGGLNISGQVRGTSGGGNPILWQHLFWFLAHPEVYVLILPAIGIIGEIIANNTRKPLWGHKTLVFSVIFLGFMSFIVWAHHMFMTGMGAWISGFFQITTMIISIPSVLILTCYLLSLWGASIRYNTPMLFALSFLPMFAIGGLTGLPLGLATSDIHLHDTYYVIGHFHYVVAPGTIFGLLAGVYFWYPKATGRMMNEALGKIHFWLSFIGMNGVFMPMLFIGMAGALRRGYDPTVYEYAAPIQGLVRMSSWSAWFLGVAQIPFIINFFGSLFAGKKVESDNPWQATTLEWATPTPPPHGNFTTEPVVYRMPYEYSVPGAKADFLPQFAAEEAK